jgi:hypothetical protein
MTKSWQDKLKQWRKQHGDEYARVLLDAPVETTMLKFVPYPGVILLMGERGMGKSVEAHAIAETLNRAQKAPAVLHLPNIPERARKKLQILMPEWMKIVQRREQWPKGGVIIYDEAAQSAHARRTQSSGAIELDNLIAISRQRRQTIIFISHHSRKLDIGIVHEVDQIHWKQPTYAHQLFEREEIADFSMRAFDFFQDLRGGRPWRECSERLKRLVKSTTIALDMSDFRFVTFKNKLPAYWSEELSCLFQDLSSQESLKKEVVKD